MHLIESYLIEYIERFSEGVEHVLVTQKYIFAVLINRDSNAFRVVEEHNCAGLSAHVTGSYRNMDKLFSSKPMSSGLFSLLGHYR